MIPRRSRLSRNRRGRPEQLGRHGRPDGRDEFPRQVTSGLFLVPDLPAAIGPTLQVLVRNFGSSDARVPFTVWGVGTNGQKTALREGSLLVAGGGFGQAVLTVPELAGARFSEITLSLPGPGLVPSAALVNVFLADSSTDLVQWFSPADFGLPSGTAA